MEVILKKQGDNIMKEIGGYMDLELYNRREYHTGLLRINTVRNAIALIMKEKGYRKLFIPKYLCSCIRIMLENRNIDYEFYNIDEKLNPVFHKVLSDEEALLLVNYYGQHTLKDLQRFQNKYKNIIVDNTQSFFQKSISSIDMVYTCRKYFGVPDGAYLNLTQSSHYYDALPIDISYQRMQHILGRFENSASAFYQEFQRVDDMFEKEDIKKMSPLTENLLRSIDYDAVKEKRMTNFLYLHKRLANLNMLTVNEENCLYMYPFFHQQGSQIKKSLLDKKIYLPTLWPNVLEECEENSFEYYLAKNLVLFPIDQRYSTDDMEYMLNQMESIQKGCETI